MTGIPTPHASQVPPRPDWGAPAQDRRDHLLACLQFAAEVVAALPVGTDPSVRVGAVDHDVTMQVDSADRFGLAAAQGFAKRVGLAEHSSFDGDDHPTTFHTWSAPGLQLILAVVGGDS